MSSKMNGNWYALRWRILNRDKFTCQYCGRAAPDVILHVDHKTAKSNGGDSDEGNLITACSACNIGKNLTPLGIPYSDPSLTRKKNSDISHSKNKETLTTKLVTFMTLNPGGWNATELSKTLGYSRPKISLILNKSALFTKKERIPKQGAYTLFCLSNSPDIKVPRATL